MSIWDAIADMVGNVKDTVQSFPAIMRDPTAVVINYPKLPTFITSTNCLPKGSVIKVSRRVAGLIPVYDHYGVYISSSSVVHFNNPVQGAETSGNNRVIETTLEEFMAGAREVDVVEFAKSKWQERRHRTYIAAATSVARMPLDLRVPSPNAHKFKQFSPDEIAQRALSQLGKDGYSLLFNNCEHFAVWCATDVRESEQVRRIFDRSAITTVRL
jgi:hypothetical protein